MRHARPSQPTAEGPGSARARLTLTVEEAAQLIGISRAQAYRCVKSGELPAVQLGRRLVVPIVVVEALLGTPIDVVDDCRTRHHRESTPDLRSPADA